MRREMPHEAVEDLSKADWVTSEQLGLTDKRASIRFPWVTPRSGHSGALVWPTDELALELDGEGEL